MPIDIKPDLLHLDEESIYPLTHKNEEWNLETFFESVIVNVVNESDDKMEIEFDLINVGASVANAIRRVLIAEVPAMAIEKVYLYQNTSVIPDEVLCHRLGLLPVYANPSHFNFPPPSNTGEEKSTDVAEEPTGDAKENVIFELNVKCKKRKSVEEASSLNQDNAERLYENAVVRSQAFKWIPIGKQAKIYAEDPPRIVNDDIVVAKLRPGQEIEARCHCVKGIGRDHAKFSPVATASYRLLPEIQILKPVVGEKAELFKSSFSKGVIDINKNGEAYVKNARKDTCSRNVYRHEEFKDSVFLGKNSEYFIFNVESTGVMTGEELVVSAIRVLRAKLMNLEGLINEKLHE